MKTKLLRETPTVPRSEDVPPPIEKNTDDQESEHNNARSIEAPLSGLLPCLDGIFADLVVADVVVKNELLAGVVDHDDKEEHGYTEGEDGGNLAPLIAVVVRQALADNARGDGIKYLWFF